MMKKLILLVATLALAGPLWASAANTKVEERLQNAAEVLQEVMNAPDKGIPLEIVEHAKCIAVIPHQIKAGFVVSSGLAFVPLPISPVYCATKAGLHSFTESLRVQLKNTKVKVFDLAPPATQTELLGGFNSEDMKGVSIMKVEDMVKVAIEGMQTDRFEIRPGQANQLKMMSRVAPGFILKQMGRSVDRMLRTQN